MNMQAFRRRLRSKSETDPLMVLLRKLQGFEAPQVRETWKQNDEGWVIWDDSRWPAPTPVPPDSPG